MKLLLCLFLLTPPFALGGDLTFRDRVYPFLKKSPTHCLLFANFDFHPNYVYETEGKDSHFITALVSYSPDDSGSITWCHFVRFHLIQGEDDESSISSIEFIDARVNTPCFIPKEVLSVDGLGQLTAHKVSVESQALLPQVEQALKQYRVK